MLFGRCEVIRLTLLKMRDSLSSCEGAVLSSLWSPMQSLASWRNVLDPRGRQATLLGWLSLCRTREWPGASPWGGHPSALCGQLCWGGAGKQALALGGETGRALWSATADGVVMPLACGVFVLLCVCVCPHFLDLATKEMETLCPVLEGDGWALSNAQFKLHPGCGV